MLGFLSAFDESELSGSKDKISFVHINAKNKEDIYRELAPSALALARKFDLKKVYLFYGKDGKIIYDYSL